MPGTGPSRRCSILTASPPACLAKSCPVPKLADDEIASALIAADWLKPIELVIQRCLGSRSSPAVALSTHPAFEVLSTSEQLEQTGRDFRNCLGGSGYERLLRGSKDIFLVWRSEEPAVLRLSQRFHL
jgi:hypothetical protein